MSLSRTLELLEDDDDVCLVDSPQELILARLESIARRYEMNFDTLSRVLRKACSLQKLEKAGVAVNHDYPLTVLALDIDNFKQLNDQYGHAKGDEVIVAIGRELCRAFPNEIVGRHGGDEFGVISWQSEAVVMQQAAEFQRRLESENKMLRGVTVSLGIAQTRVTRRLAILSTKPTKHCTLRKPKAEIASSVLQTCWRCRLRRAMMWKS